VRKNVIPLRAIIVRVDEIRPIDDGDLERWVAAMRSVDEDTGTVEDYVDWRRQAQDTVWLLASDGARELGAGIGVAGWHEPPGVARGDVRVARDERSRGIGSSLLGQLGSWARDLGYGELIGEVREQDAESIAWTQRRGYVEVGRNSRLVLDLASVEPPEVNPPAAVTVTTWAERPELIEDVYTVACEAYPDVPGEEDEVMPSFEQWLSMDMQGVGDRPEATFVALAGDEVAGYAKLSISNARPGVAMHDMTGVRRSLRGRGIAGALKRAEIAWAKRNGFTRLETANEERNEPIRRLNQRHGYMPEPGHVVVRGPITGRNN
jgi:GNAT superfamily N-acetyltransferase